MKKLTFLPLLLLISVLLPSCLKSELDDYDKWREKNEAYIRNVDKAEYKPYSPVWAPASTVYIKWHNDTSLTKKNLQPLSTSTVRLKYEMENIDGTYLGDSYAASDSVYECKPSDNIVGFWSTVTAMHVGDSVTVIIPYESAYGSRITGSIWPYSNLIYRIKLVSIPAYERPNS